MCLAASLGWLGRSMPLRVVGEHGTGLWYLPKRYASMAKRDKGSIGQMGTTRHTEGGDIVTVITQVMNSFICNCLKNCHKWINYLCTSFTLETKINHTGRTCITIGLDLHPPKQLSALPLPGFCKELWQLHNTDY
jgi:hypothetical protein